MNRPVIILVEPQMGENIGMCARAMLNFDLHDLRLVNPRDGWPNGRALASAAGADDIINRTEAYPDLRAALADLQFVYATCPRTHDLIKPVHTSRGAIEKIRAQTAAGMRLGIVFGPERAGLTNEDVALCDELICYPTNPGFYSLNLAQAVMVMAYEWFQSADATPSPKLHYGRTQPAQKSELYHLYARLEEKLNEAGFFTSEEQRPTMQRNLRTAFMRAQLTEQEVRTLQGVITALADKPKKNRT